MAVFRDQKVHWEGQWSKTLSHSAGMTLRTVATRVSDPLKEEISVSLRATEFW